MVTLKIIAALLHYPDEPIQTNAAELITVLDQDGMLGGRARAAVIAFIERLHGSDLLERQAEYVDTFDRGRSRSLYLFEHVHGESRDRGQAMVDLRQAYWAQGLEITVSELPDYLPLFLEFCSTLPAEQAVAWLEDIGPLLALLHARLREHGSPYCVLLEPLLALADVELEDAALDRQIAGEAPDDTPEALDRVWMETPVTFGPGVTGCTTAAPDRGETLPWPSHPGRTSTGIPV